MRRSQLRPNKTTTPWLRYHNRPTDLYSDACKCISSPSSEKRKQALFSIHLPTSSIRALNSSDSCLHGIVSRSTGFCVLFSLSYNRPTIKQPWRWKIDIAANRFGTLQPELCFSSVGLSGHGPKTLHNHDEKRQVGRGCEIVCELTIPTSRDSLLHFWPAVYEIHDSDPEIWDLCESHKSHKNNIHQQRQGITQTKENSSQERL